MMRNGKEEEETTCEKLVTCMIEISTKDLCSVKFHTVYEW